LFGIVIGVSPCALFIGEGTLEVEPMDELSTARA